MAGSASSASSATPNLNEADDHPFPHRVDRDGPVDAGFATEFDGADEADDERETLGGELVELRPDVLLDAFRVQVESGREWFEAMLDCIRQWRIPRETVDGREYVYLIEREAFDWLLLAERICDSAPPGLLPADEVEELLVEETPPARLSEAEFQERLGTAKYWAHLNFLYGVRVEQALHLAVERTVHKERGGWSFSHDRAELDSDVFGRIYGARQAELLSEFREQTSGGLLSEERIEHAEWQAFTYWLFRRRIERQDPARVASDTRQGLEMLYELEAAKQRRLRRRTLAGEQTIDEDAVIDGVLVGVG